MLLHRFTTALARTLAIQRPVVVQAHCDTLDGPAVTAGRAALETGNLNHALAWIPADDEAELREVFDRVLAVRALGGDAATLADRLFLETLVRLHRMGEGVGFTGLQPAGTIEPLVAAADTALATGDDGALLAAVPAETRTELHERFLTARALQDHDVDDVAAGRRALAAYVRFVKLAEGEEHDHGHGAHGHATHDHVHTHDGVPAAHAH